MAESSGRKRRGGEDGPAGLNEVMISFSAESSFDVFLSFSGSDNLLEFTDCIYRRLIALGHRVFRDDGTPKLLPLWVCSSIIYMPIFSRTYAHSFGGLDMLAFMVKDTSKSGGKKEILPVFYDVERLDVNMERASLYSHVLRTHRLKGNAEKVEQWKKALVEASKVKGWELSSYESEGELITKIVGEISSKLKIKHNYVPKDQSIGAGPLKANVEHSYVPVDLSTGDEPLKTDIKHEDLFTSAEPLKTDIEHEDLFTCAEPLKTDIEHEDLFTCAEPLKTDTEHEDLFTSAEPLKTDIEHEDLLTGTGPLKANKFHKYEPEDLYTGADPLEAQGNRINVYTRHLKMEHAEAKFQAPMLSPGTSATWRWSLIRSVVTFLCFLFRLKRIRDRVTSKWSLLRPVLCFLFRLQTIRNKAHSKRIFHRRVSSSGTLSTSEIEDSQELPIISLLDTEVNDVRIIGIHGRDGIGKTALAKMVYNKISLLFDACSFLGEIEETMQQPGGIQCLQTKLIFDILKREYEVASAFKGIRFLKGIFKNMKVLLVLDDVENGSHLKAFIGAKLDWFGSGSRIIVTSKQRSVLQGFVDRGLAHTYDVSPMDDDRAFNLFWQYAMGKSNKVHPYVEIANKIVKAAEGLPLLVKVFGSFLHGKGRNEWIEFGDLVQQKQMYLDIAGFLPDVDCSIASYMWHDYDRPHDEIKVLRCMSLITMEENKLGMHSMLRCLARKIIHEGFHDPGTCVGFNIPATAQDTKKRKTGTDHLNAGVGGFEIPPNATFLSLGHANISGKFADALLNIRWLHWQGCPRDSEAISVDLKNLVILDLSWSKVTESWGGWTGIKMDRLKVLNLTGCADLIVTPSFSCYPNLEMLILEQCSRLVHLDPTINDLPLLVTLNLKFCSELSMLPEEMAGMNALKELLIDGTSIRELPASIGKLVQLQILSATNCLSLVELPGSICELKALLVLALDNAKILELPESIGDLGELRRLSLRDCRELGKLPESIGKLEDSLEELDISGTGILKLPNSTGDLRSLKVLKMDSCFVREFPRDIGELINLEEVHASWCRSLEGVIPSDISKLHCLRELRLRCTRISSLPSEIQFMSSLQTLDLLQCDILKELPILPTNLIHLYVNPGLMQNV